MQTAAEVVPHPKWDKMVYFVCSSLELNDPVASSKGTQEELLHEAQLEVQELKQLVQGYIRKQSRSGTSLGKNTVCVMFPTRLTVSAATLRCPILSAHTMYTQCCSPASIHSPSSHLRKLFGRARCTTYMN